MAVVRATARVLPVSEDGAVLLLRELDPAVPERPYWSSIGGGVEAEESLLDAAVRELHEETGIEVAAGALRGPVHAMQHASSWNHEDRLGFHTYFALALSRQVEVSREFLQPAEVDSVLGAAWWTPGDLAAETFVEPGLPTIMRTAIEAVEATEGDS